jgi:hypothetical protein
MIFGPTPGKLDIAIAPDRTRQSRLVTRDSRPVISN